MRNGAFRLGVCSLLCLFSGCNIGQKTPTLSLQAPPASIAAGSQMVFTASISHNNGQFEGATWALMSSGAACPSACGTLTNPTNTGSSGNGDTATITYTAPATPPTPNSITVTATSVENPSSSGSGTFTVTASALVTQSVYLAPDATGVPYLPVTLQATGGISPYTWSIPMGNGTLPSGLSLSSAGVISGTPTAAGTFAFNTQVQDSAGTVASTNESIMIAGPSAGAQPNITGLTVYSDSSDSHYTTVTTDDGSQTDMWGDKDSNGMVTSLRSLRVQASDGTANTFSFDSTGNLVRFGPENGITFNLDWQGSVATVVAYIPSGTAIAGPTQFTLAQTPALALRPAQSAERVAAVRRMATKAMPTLPSNAFEVQVNRCGKPFDGASVEVIAQDSILLPRLSIAPATGSGTYDVIVPVTVPNSAIAPTVAFCDTVANWYSSIAQSWSNAKIGLAQTCMIMTTVAVIASDGAGLVAAAQINAACLVALGSMYELDAVMATVSSTAPSSYKTFCDTAVPIAAGAINAATVVVNATVSIPGVQTVALGPYGSTFPGSGLPPAVVNIDKLGVCDIAGSWQGGWARSGIIHNNGVAVTHSGALAAAITDTSTPDTYNIDLSVTDSRGTNKVSFPGVPTSESDLGYTFNFGPAEIDGVTGTAAGYLTPDGKGMSGNFTAPGAAGWGLVKQ
jgi:hypothetical protein